MICRLVSDIDFSIWVAVVVAAAVSAASAVVVAVAATAAAAVLVVVVVVVAASLVDAPSPLIHPRQCACACAVGWGVPASLGGSLFDRRDARYWQ